MAPKRAVAAFGRYIPRARKHLIKQDKCWRKMRAKGKTTALLYITCGPALPIGTTLKGEKIPPTKLVPYEKDGGDMAEKMPTRPCHTRRQMPTRFYPYGRDNTNAAHPQGSDDNPQNPTSVTTQHFNQTAPHERKEANEIITTRDR